MLFYFHIGNNDHFIVKNRSSKPGVGQKFLFPQQSRKPPKVWVQKIDRERERERGKERERKKISNKNKKEKRVEKKEKGKRIWSSFP